MIDTQGEQQQQQRVTSFVPDKKKLSEYAKERGFTASGFLRHLWLKELKSSEDK